MRRLAVTGVLILVSIAACGGPAGAEAQVAVVDDLYHAVTTLRDVNSLGIAIDAYYRDHKEYPHVATSAELKSLLEPGYAAHLESVDAWGTDLKYLPTPDHQEYRLISAGSDRQFDAASWTSPGVFTDSRSDAVFSGRFVRRWAISFP